MSSGSSAGWSTGELVVRRTIGTRSQRPAGRAPRRAGRSVGLRGAWVSVVPHVDVTTATAAHAQPPDFPYCAAWCGHPTVAGGQASSRARVATAQLPRDRIDRRPGGRQSGPYPKARVGCAALDVSLQSARRACPRSPPCASVARSGSGCTPRAGRVSEIAEPRQRQAPASRRSVRAASSSAEAHHWAPEPAPEDDAAPAEWIARQITEAFPWDAAPRCLIRDRDTAYGVAVTRRLRAMGIRDRPIAPRSPWQNGHH
jgi:hypothetical protein